METPPRRSVLRPQISPRILARSRRPMRLGAIPRVLSSTKSEMAMTLAAVLPSGTFRGSCWGGGVLSLVRGVSPGAACYLS